MQVPNINGRHDFETPYSEIIWSACNGAIKYELAQKEPGEDWKIIYTGTALKIESTQLNYKSIFRVRAVYKTIVSPWSQEMEHP
jgi:hypothetical protein